MIEGYICPRYDTAANYTANNPTLQAGEIAYESDTGKGKLGDGATAWVSLAYASSGDMLKATYDPTNVHADAFSMTNMVEGATNKILTATERTKLAGIAAGAEVNVNADWTSGAGDSQILNKPTLVTLAQVYPVGSIYLSAVSTNPATLFGFGTWAALAAGRVLIGVDPGDTDFDTVEETGGAKTVAAAGTVDAPVFTGSALATHTHTVGTIAPSAHAGTAVADHAAHTHGVTSNVAVGAHTPTQPTVAWPAGVPTASGGAVADHAAHTHSVTSNVTVADHTSHTHTYTDVPNHTHPHNLQGGTTGATTGTNVMASTATGGSARAMAIATSNPTGGVATGTTAGPGAALAHTPTNNAVTSDNPSATLTHSVTNPTVAWPAGVPTASGGGVDAHSVTNNAVTSANPSATLTHSVTQPSDHTMSGSTAAITAGTPAGTNSAPTFTGTPTSVVQPYLTCYMWKRTA